MYEGVRDCSRVASAAQPHGPAPANLHEHQQASPSGWPERQRSLWAASWRSHSTSPQATGVCSGSWRLLGSSKLHSQQIIMRLLLGQYPFYHEIQSKSTRKFSAAQKFYCQNLQKCCYLCTGDLGNLDSKWWGVSILVARFQYCSLAFNTARSLDSSNCSNAL